MATQEPVESGSCPSVTRGVYVVVVLDNPEMRLGRLGGSGSFSENLESPGDVWKIAGNVTAGR